MYDISLVGMRERGGGRQLDHVQLIKKNRFERDA